jgi:hypothetical protein
MNTLMILLEVPGLGQLYEWGGVPFMHPLTLLFIINICVISYAILMRVLKKELSLRWVESIRHVANLAAAFGTFSTIIGLFFAFNAIEDTPELIPFQVISGGLKVGLITVLYGLIIFLISYSFYIILKATHKTVASEKQ